MFQNDDKKDIHVLFFVLAMNTKYCTVYNHVAILLTFTMS